MNQLKSFVFGLICIFSYSVSTYAQGELILGLEYGFNKPWNQNTSKLQLFQAGNSADLSLGYYFGKIGVAMGVRQVFGMAPQDTINKEDIIGLIRAGQNGGRHGQVATYVGPTWRFGKGKFGVSASPQIGMIKPSFTEVSALASGQNGKDLLVLFTAQKANWQPVLSGDIGVNFKVSRRIALQLNAGFLTNKPFGAKQLIFDQATNENGEALDISAEEIAKVLSLDELVSSELQQVNLSAGIQVSLGGQGANRSGNIASIPLKKSCDCFKKCVDRQMSDCKYNKQNCKNDAKTCKRTAKTNFKNCKKSCTGSRKSKRQCKKTCKRNYKAAKKICKADKKRCKKMKCKKSNYKAACEKTCGCK